MAVSEAQRQLDQLRPLYQEERKARLAAERALELSSEEIVTLKHRLATAEGRLREYREAGTVDEV